MATNDATARRRRIAERGSDRMAIITGRAQGIPSSPSSPSAAVAQAHHSYTASCPSVLADQLHHPDDSPVKGEITGNSDGGGVKPYLRKCETSVEGRQSTFEPDKRQSFPTTSTDQNPKLSSSNKVPKSQLQSYLHKTLRPDILRPAIAASQDIRRQCSFAAGILVLLSYIGFPIIGSFLFRSIILSRPLILLLLTNITIVVAPLVLENPGGMEKFEQELNAGSSTAETDFTDHLGVVLEWGLLLKSCLGAFFMDAGIYSVIVVCGISFLQKLGL